MIKNALKILLTGSIVFVSLNANAVFNIRSGVGHCDFAACSSSFDRAESKCSAKSCRSQATVVAIAIRVQCEQLDPFLRIAMNIRDCGVQAKDAERQLSQTCDSTELACIKRASASFVMCNTFCATLR